MKKIASIILTGVLITGILTGCDLSSAKSDDQILKVAIDLKYPPFMYVDDKGDPAGLEVDLAYALGEYMGQEVEIVNTDFSMLIPSLETGESDIVISDMTVNDERKQKVDFSEGYRYGRTLALVNKEFYENNNISDDMSVEDFFKLDGIKSIGLSGTISVSVPQKYGVDVTEITEIASGIMEVTSGNYNVLVGANTVIGDHAANKETTEIYSGIPEYFTSAFAVKKGNTELLEKANEFIATLYEKGGLYEQLASKYNDEVGEFLKDKSLGLEYIVNKPE
ncbi:transporter substrate-binding domain-containing protein [Clostridium grantii]|uniref:Amino acid ABC transporter substrate-binding protein, PAAT family (TC 3.A.1.3.-) n=1 Tax=Clostridium grantii DSM 8605 TaxID=1121316 RepID=A0A1M5XET7_9CLOT|nr:transporter substrate-binding domain-containing protein [Clostridium grantii]SHH98311.1 amino acid ABC transporter substrate-binding protein, PAAT family (TC 3.A.1.3.-) [Clostridium grantii DSM 8605]